jgi:hypothetical protein
MRRVALVVCAALALPPTAAAKEPLHATICGASACMTVTDRATLNQIPGGEATRPLGPAAPYYTVDVVAGEHGNPQNQHAFSMYYVPAENAMAWAETGIVRLHPIFGEPTTRLMRDLTADLEPFPAPWLTAVSVGGRKVDAHAAQSYLRLYEQKTEAALAESPSDWLRVDLRSVRPSPWTESRPDLMFSPSADLLEVGGNRVKISDELASDVEARRALESSSTAFPWGTLGLSALGALLLASLGKKRRSPPV